MTSPARIAMLFAARDALQDAARVTAAQTEGYLALLENERDAFLRHCAQQNTPEAIRARARRLASYRRRRQAAERGARTVPAYGARTVDMAAFEKQFRRTSS